MFSATICAFISLVSFSKASVLLWSTTNLEISPLRPFNDNSLEELIQYLGYPEITLYKSSASLLPKFEELLEGFYKAYSPNGHLNHENATEISEEDFELLEAKQRLDLSAGNNVLSVLILPHERSKREVDDEEEEEVPSKSVLYRFKSNKDIYSLIYSSQPLILNLNNNSVELGDSISVTMDKKNTSSRLDVTIPVKDEKYILQFFFMWQSNMYWSLNTVKVKSTSSAMNYSVINLAINEPFSVPAHFSYHCNGLTTFSDAEKTTELLIYDLQAQPDSKTSGFGDVYDCVDFTTVPIWSGLFVTGMLAIGLLVALNAISQIKTMDKFDNQKTKQLVITFAE